MREHFSPSTPLTAPQMLFHCDILVFWGLVIYIYLAKQKTVFGITLQFRLGQKSTVKASWHYWWIWNVQEEEGQGRCRWESLHASPLSCLFQAARRSSRSEQAHLVQVITTAKCIWTLIPTLWSAGPQLATARTLSLHLLNQREPGAAIYKYIIYGIQYTIYKLCCDIFSISRGSRVPPALTM